MGVFIFHIFGALAEMELGLIRERTILGLRAARERGRIGGRPKGLSRKLLMQKFAVKEYYQQGKPILEICELTGLSRASIYTVLEHLNIPLKKPLVKAKTH
jgi:DNA invertase Pin-like site-specific DNA recombinase